MKINIKTLVIIVATGLVCFLALSWYYNRQLDKKDDQIRLNREELSAVEEYYDDKIGTYSARLGTLSDNLQKEKGITDEQREAIKQLQKNLNAKINEINLLTVRIDTLLSEGQAEIIYAEADTVTYKIHEYKQSITLDVIIHHPSGNYTTSIVQDPLTMELYMAKEKGTGYRVGSIRFPNNPHITVSKWDLIYDEDLRPWYQRIWDNIHFDVGAFGGNSAGISTMIIYNRLGAGPVFTEEGMNIGIVYRLK